MRYKIGLYGGSFNPLHLGHVDCIIQAANQCERLYLILCIGKNRDEIDHRLRYRWLYMLTKHIGNITILSLEDDAPTKAAYSEADWHRDAQTIKAQIGAPIDAVFVGSDYGPDSYWRACYPESALVVFPRNGISSTAIRQNPYAHWHWLPDVVRPYYTKKVLIMGSESVGKSTITINLKNRFNGAYIEEAGREISLRSGTDQLMVSADYTEILVQHKCNEIKAMEQGKPLLFVDTDALYTQFYMVFLQDPQIEQNKALSDAIDAVNRYDLILFFEPDVAFVQDGTRNDGIAAERVKYSEQIKAILRRHGREFVCISGDYQSRYEQAVAAVQRLLD